MNARGEQGVDGRGVVFSEGLDLTARAEGRWGFVDLTDDLNRVVKDAGVWEGACLAFCRHTTCALVINEWEDGALEDLRAHIERTIPPSAYYAHDDHSRRTQNLIPAERRNGAAHVAAMLMGGASLIVPIRRGALHLGRWQRVILVELDEPKERSIAVQFLPSIVASPPLRRAHGVRVEAS